MEGTSPTKNNTEIQIIDGSVLEGGGQILRNAISLAGLLRKRIRIENIRHGRSQPGLKNQHRTGLELAAEIASAKLIGASNGSTIVEFEPVGEKVELPGRCVADSVTAGATTLLMQIALPLLLFKSSSPSLSSSSSSQSESSVLSLLGGTNAGQAPQVDYTQHVFLPFFRSHFLPKRTEGQTRTSSSPPPSVELEIKKRGYFPKGGGELELRVHPLLPGEKLRPVNLGAQSRGKLIRVGGIAHYAGLPRAVGDGMRDGAVKMIRECIRSGKWSQFTGADEGAESEIEVDIVVKRERNRLTRGAGSGIVAWAEFGDGTVLGGSAVGEKGVEPTEVGRAAVEELSKGVEAGGCIEEWMQDQIIIFMALAEGRSEVRCGTVGLSLHTKTAIWVMEQLTEAKFEVEQGENGQWVIRCDGTGFTVPRELEPDK